MAGNYKYFRFYLNREDEAERELLEYLDSLSGRDRSKFIKECLLRDRIVDESENFGGLKEIEERLCKLEIKVNCVAVDDILSNNENNIDWHCIWEERKNRKSFE